jgi:hypothetical protein
MHSPIKIKRDSRKPHLKQGEFILIIMLSFELGMATSTFYPRARR